MANKIHLTAKTQMGVDHSFCKSLMESAEYAQVDEVVKAVKEQYDQCLERLQVRFLFLLSEFSEFSACSFFLLVPRFFSHEQVLPRVAKFPFLGVRRSQGQDL